MNAGRRCALPGCYVVIEPPEDGLPQRKYCTSAHRAIARQQRREGTQRSASAPPLPLPAAPADQSRRPARLLRELPLPPLVHGPEAPTARRSAAPSRRTRTLAMLGSAGLLITGTTLSLADTPSGTDATTATPWRAQDPETEQNWASEARVSLSSIERQLADVQAAARDWNSLPAEERTGEVPEGILDLARRKALLEQQRTTLTERLATYDQYDRARQDLAADERSVAELDRTLSAAPAPSQASPAEADDVRRLREQRDARARVLADQRQAVDRMRGDIRETMAGSLPAAGDQATRAITAEARVLVRDPARRRAARQSGTPRVPSTPDQAGRVPGEILAAPSLPGPSVSGPSVSGPSVSGPSVSSPGARPGGPRPDILAAPPVVGGLLDRVGGGPAAPGAPSAAPADGGPLDGGLPVDPGVGPVEGLAQPIESSVSGRTVSRVANVAYDQAAPAPAAAGGAGGAVDAVVGTLPAPAAPSRSAPSPPDLGSSAVAGGFDPITTARAGLAAKASESAISNLQVSDDVKNTARVLVGAEILRQSAAENRRYQATGGRDDPKRVTQTLQAMAAAKVIEDQVRRDPRGSARLLAGAAAVAAANQGRPADRERVQRLLSGYVKQRATVDALSGRYRSSRQIESAVRDQLRSAARRSVEDRFRSSARRSVEDRFRSSARRSIEKSLRSSARRSIEKSLRSSARRSIEKSFRSSARRSVERSFRKAISRHFDR